MNSTLAEVIEGNISGQYTDDALINSNGQYHMLRNRLRYFMDVAMVCVQ